MPQNEDDSPGRAYGPLTHGSGSHGADIAARAPAAVTRSQRWLARLAFAAAAGAVDYRANEK